MDIRMVLWSFTAGTNGLLRHCGSYSRPRAMLSKQASSARCAALVHFSITSCVRGFSSVLSEARWPHAIVFQTHGGFAESVPYLLQKGSALSGLPRLDRFDVSHGHLVQELDVPALDIHVAPMSEVGISLTAFTTMCHRAPRSPKMWMHGSAHNLLLFRLTNLLRHEAPTRALQHVGPCAYCHRAPHARQRGHQTKRSHTGEEDEVAVTPRKRQRPSTATDGRYTTNQNTAANMPTDCQPAPLIYYAPKSAGDVDQIRGWATEWGGVR